MRLDRGADRVVVGHVDRERERAATGGFDRRGGLARVRFVEVDDGDRGAAFGGELARSRGRCRSRLR